MIAIAKEKLALAYLTRLNRYTGVGGSYLFTRDLFVGRAGNDVVELQKRFAREGLANYAPTGYFGPLTKASAIAYQQKHNITPIAGYVGPKTRSVLNGGVSVAPAPTGAPAEVDAILLSELSIWS